MPPTPAPDRLTQLLSRPGDLVPDAEPWSVRAVDKRALPELLSELVDKRPAASKCWQSANLPLDNPQRPALHLPASTCAVQLANDMVGVLKIQQNGDCTLFVRLKRAQTNAWADNHKQPRSGARMFWRTLDTETDKVCAIFKQAKAFVLAPNQVHHPHVLSILCLMSRERWTVPPAAEAPLLPTRKGSFTLVGLPPLPEHFEQCLVLLGCTAAFVDMDDDDAPLSARQVTRNTWGDTPRPLVAGDMRDLFAFAGEELGTHANANIFTRVIPALNKHAPEANEVLGAVRANYYAEEHEERRVRGELDEEEEAEEATEEAAPAPAAAAADESGDEVLAPSDDDDDGEVEGTSQARAAPRSGGAASSSSSTTASAPAPSRAKKSRARPRAPQAKKKKKPTVVQDDDSDADQGDDDDGAGSVGRQDAELSDVPDSSEEEDDSSSDSSSDSDSDAAPRRPAKQARRASSDDDEEDEEEEAAAAEESPPAPASSAGSDQALCDLLIQMAKPCHEKLQRHLRAHGAFLLARYANQLKTDVELLQSARSPVALLAAALSVINTLTDVQEDRARGCSMLLHWNELGRLGEMAAQTKEFAEAIRAFLDRAGPA